MNAPIKLMCPWIAAMSLTEHGERGLSGHNE